MSISAGPCIAGCRPPSLCSRRRGNSNVSSRPQQIPVKLLKRLCRAQAQEDSSKGGPSEIVNASDESGHAIQAADDEEFEGLLPEEDWVVPGGANDSLSSNTQLGQAVDNVCKELGILGSREQEVLANANELLRKLGYKGNITEGQDTKE